MTAVQQATMSAIENQAFALMSRLHVTLRREQNRVTDIEYMRQDPAYCRHVLGLAGKIDNEDVRGVCTRLEEIYFGPEGLFPPPPPAPPKPQSPPLRHTARPRALG